MEENQLPVPAVPGAVGAGQPAAPRGRAAGKPQPAAPHRGLVFECPQAAFFPKADLAANPAGAGISRALVSPWRCPARHGGVSCSSPSRLCLHLLFPCNLFSFRCPLPGLARNSYKSRAIRKRRAAFPTGLWPRLLARAGAGTGHPVAGSTLPRAWGVHRASFYFFLLESSNGG